MQKTVVITGGAKGIGKETAVLFARNGYNVVINYNSSEEPAKQLKHSIEDIGVKCAIMQCDLTNFSQTQRMFKLIEMDFGDIDVLVCNAGIAQQKLFTDITEDDWDTMMNTNVKGVFNACKGAIPMMLRKQAGSIVTVSSMWGEVGASCEVHYSASKSAVIGFTKALAKEMGYSGIRVNCVSPGVIDTDMNNIIDEETMQSLSEETPLGKIGEPSDVAEAIFYLASEHSKFITGQVLGVNGGFVI